MKITTNGRERGGSGRSWMLAHASEGQILPIDAILAGDPNAKLQDGFSLDPTWPRALLWGDR